MAAPPPADPARQRFEALLAAHLDAAHNLARWLIRYPSDAEDCLQEACLRALRYFDGYRGGDARAWLLAIVRNTCYSWLEQHQIQQRRLEYRDDLEFRDDLEYRGHDSSLEGYGQASHSQDPLSQLLRAASAQQLEQAIRALPAEYREVVVLREMEELPYKQIADIAGVPIGTVMSRLSRARMRLRALLLDPVAAEKEGQGQ